jgi:hypothetical protein
VCPERAEGTPRFTLAVPSWVTPGTHLENLLFIADTDDTKTIGGVELLFFIYDDSVRDGFMRELPDIRRLAGRLVFTAHLPDRLDADADADALVELLAPLVRHFVVHPSEDAPKQAVRLREWEARYGKGRFLLENTAAGLLEGLLPRLDGFPLCMDTAHLLREGKSPADFAARHGNRIAEVHLNGRDADGDHRPLRDGDKWLAELMPFLRGFSGLVNIELFDWDGICASLSCLERGLSRV